MICPSQRIPVPLFSVLSLLFPVLAFGQDGALRVIDPAPSKDGTIVTTEAALSLKGTLAWKGGDKRVLWESNRGFSDLATVTLADDRQTVLWNSTSPIPLRPGVNHVRIKALGQPGAATFVNVLYTPRSPAAAEPLRTTTFQGKQVRYEERDGLAIYQNDIILGKAADLAAGTSTNPPSPKGIKGMHANALTIGPNLFTSTGLWPVVNGVARVPYTITPQSTANTANINAAIAESNTQLTGIVQWVPATSSDVNLVNFDFDPTNLSGACEASVGMVGNTQTIGGSINCTVTTILHEMGHALGLYHEQSRADRNAYVNFMEQNIDKPNEGNFDLIPANIASASVDAGLYNYASIMEYGPFSFDKDGVSPTLETIPAGMVLGTTMPQYTTGDLDGIMRLYAHAPSAITVDTNPSGLQVLVDGAQCTAPCAFTAWTTGSQHTLNVPLDAHNQTLQTLNGQNYIFGRWNASATGGSVPSNGGCPSTGCSVMVTNSPGNGTLLSPSTSPAITGYLASFIPVHPYSPVVSPAGDGTITPMPAPSTLTINGTSANYYQDRQLVTFTVTPNAGFNFLFWANVPVFNIYINPLTFYITDNFDSSFNGNPTTATLVSDAVTTITASSPDLSAEGIFPGFAIAVTDGKGNTSTAYTPTNFDATYNGAGFASGETLTFTSAASASPVTTNISYTFNNWSGAGTPSGDTLSVQVPASGRSNSTANYTPSFRSIVDPAIGTATFCPDSSGHNELTVTASPPGTNQNGTFGNVDAFFNTGTVDFTASTGASGLSFVGWSQDFSGTTNPLSYPLTGQVLGTANFNLSGITTPLSVTGILPVPTVTTGPVTLTVTGTGFSTSTSTLFTYYVDPSTGIYHYRSNTPGTSTQLTMQLCGAGAGCPDGEPSTWPGDISTAGYYQIVVLNVETATNCNPSATATFAVANSAGPPVLGITKSHVGNFSPGQQNAQYTVLVSNTGTGPTVDPVTVTETAPSGETLVSMSGSGWTCTSGGNTCTRSDALSAGMSYGAITVTVDVASNATSPQVNTVLASGGGSASATATDSTMIGSMTAPTIAKAFSPASISSGGSSTVTLTLTNSNTTALTGGAFTDTLSNMSAAGGSVGGTCPGTTPGALTAGATALSFSGITIPASGSCTVTFNVASTTNGTNPNTTSGVTTTQTPTAGAASNSADLTVTALAAPTIAKAFSPASISSGGSSTVTLTLTNSNTTALTGGAFTDTLSNMSAAGGSVGGTCEGTTPSTLTAGAAALSFSGIAIPASGGCTVTFSVTSATNGTNPNTTSGVTTTQTPTAGVASNTADLTVTALSTPTIAKAFAPATIQSGGSSTVTLTLTNSNTIALTGGAFTDTLSKMSASGGSVGGTCVGTTPTSLTAGATALSFSGIAIPASGSCTVTFSVTSSTAGSLPNTTSGVKTTQTPTAGSVSNKATLTVLAAPTIAKAFNPASILSGGSSTVTLTLKNTNTTALMGGAFTDTLSNMSAVGGAVRGTCAGTTPSTLTAGATALSFSGITIPTNNSCTVTFSVTSSTPGSQPNTTSGVTTTQTPTAGTASNTATLSVGLPTITKAFNPTSIPSGGSSTVTLTLKNTNTTPLTGGAFTDTLSKMSALGGAVGGTCVGTTPTSLTAGATALSFSGITIPANSSCTVAFSVTSSTVGSLPNATSGVKTTQTPTAGTGSNTATLDVGAPTIAKAFAPSTIQSGGSSTVTLTLTNSNTAALTGGAFSDTLSKMSALGGAVGGTCVGTTPTSLTAGATALSFSGITIPASGSCTVTFSVTSSTAGSLPNATSGVKTTQTPTAGSVSNTATLTVLAAPTITKAFNPASIPSGGSSTVTLTLKNTNTTALTGGAFTDTLSNMSAVGGAVGGTCVGTTPNTLTAGATALSFSGVTIPANSSCTVTFSVTSSTPGSQPNTTSGVTTTQTPTAGTASNTATLTVN